MSVAHGFAICLNTSCFTCNRVTTKLLNYKPGRASCVSATDAHYNLQTKMYFEVSFLAAKIEKLQPKICLCLQDMQTTLQCITRFHESFNDNYFYYHLPKKIQGRSTTSSQAEKKNLPKGEI